MELTKQKAFVANIYFTKYKRMLEDIKRARLINPLIKKVILK
jgi:hypothetical protein